MFEKCDSKREKSYLLSLFSQNALQISILQLEAEYLKHFA